MTGRSFRSDGVVARAARALLLARRSRSRASGAMLIACTVRAAGVGGRFVAVADPERDNLSESLGSCCQGGRAKLSRPAARSAPPLWKDTALKRVDDEARLDRYLDPPDDDPPDL